MISQEHLRTLRWSLILLGLGVPILPRALAPVLFPNQFYMDTLGRMFCPPSGSWSWQTGWILRSCGACAWTLLPFAFLAWLTRFHSGGRALAGIAGACLPCLLMGWWIHWPETRPGMDFGEIFFPIYAALIMPFVYGVGRLIARLMMGKEALRG